MAGFYYFLHKNQISADTVSSNSNWKIKLVLVEIDPVSGKGTLTAYNQKQQIIGNTPVYVGLHPDQIINNLYQKSVAGCTSSRESGSCMTSLGVYTALDWTKPLPAPLQNEWFLNLEGQPVFGGDPVCSSKVAALGGKTCRHIGIHFTNIDQTHGCIGIPDAGVCKTLTDSLIDFSGAKVIVTDYALRGSIFPKDQENYTIELPHIRRKSDNTLFSGTVTISGSSSPAIDNFANLWVAETAAPDGKFEITSSTPGYQSKKTIIEIKRDTNHKIISTNVSGEALIAGTPNPVILGPIETVDLDKPNMADARDVFSCCSASTRSDSCPKISKTIFLDAGHSSGYNDFPNGYVVSGTNNEGDDNSLMANKVKQNLENRGYKVVLSGSPVSNDAADLQRRVTEGNTSKPDAFVSLHSNDSNDGGSGIMGIVYCDNGKSSGDSTIALSDDSSCPPNDLTDKSKQLSRSIVDKVQAAFSFSGGEKFRGGHAGVLRGLTMPAVIIEMFAHDNVSDISKVNNHENQLAQTIAEGIVAFVGK